MNKQQERDIYIIPPNFIDTGTFFGGMFKARNVIEAGVLAVAIGLPVLFWLPFSLTTRIVLLCLTALPAALIALIGIDGESLTSFLYILQKFGKNRRFVGGTDEELQALAEKRARHVKRSRKNGQIMVADSYNVNYSNQLFKPTIQTACGISR